jgi:hypothetical protein
LQKVIKRFFMRITEDGDRLNNYANDPKSYAAEPMTPEQKKTYVAVGIGSGVMLAVLVAIATLVS